MEILFNDGIKQNLKAQIVLIQIDQYAGNYERDLANMLIGPDELMSAFNNPCNQEEIKKHQEYYNQHNIEEDYFSKKVKTTVRNYCGQKSEHYYCMTNIDGEFNGIAFFFKKELSENDFNILKDIATDFLATKDVNVVNMVQYKNGEPVEFNNAPSHCM